ncbi:MAG: glycosyl hydrolase 53 family protein [Acidobacteria bacterium]|nr:glycosyl hydrolase 53 family protein [Acidobacteriota bacterium]
MRSFTLVVLAVAVLGAQSGTLLDDAFTASRLDLGKWDLLSDSGAAISTGSGLKTSFNGSTALSQMRAFTLYQFSGDFDVQVDFSLGSGWNSPIPVSAGGSLIGAGLMVFQDDPNWIEIFRSRFANTEGFTFASRADDLAGTSKTRFFASSAGSGSLRIVSNAGSYHFSFNTGNGWVELGSVAAFKGPVRIALQTAKFIPSVSFATTLSNFQVNSGVTDYKTYQLPASMQKRASYQIGGQFINEAIRRWNAGFLNYRPMEQLAAQGMTMARGCMTTGSDPELASTPSDQWAKLGWKNSYWSSREMVAQLFKDAMAAGMRINACFYLGDGPSDSWNQVAPVAWKGLSVDDTATRIEQYTFETTSWLQSQGIKVDLYDPGNEILYGMMNFLPGDRAAAPPPGVNPTESVSYMESAVWPAEAKFLRAAIRGIRRADPGARVALHVEGNVGPGTDQVPGFFKAMQTFGVPYDVASISLPYPNYTDLSGHTAQSYMQRLDNLVNRIAALGKPVFIAETAYPAAAAPGLLPPMSGFPYSDAGQAGFWSTLLRWSSGNPNIVGLTWFYPEWFPGISGNSNTPVIDVLGFFSDPVTLRPAARAMNENLPAAPCSFTLTAKGTPPAAVGGSGSAAVSAPYWCRWTATSEVPWIVLDAGGSGMGDGTLGLSFSPNTSGISRSGVVAVAGQKIAFNQSPVPPAVSGIAPIFSSSTTIQPGSWVSIYGASLSSGTTVWDGKPLSNGTNPTTLGDISSVTFNGKPGYLWLVSPLQINVQAPDDLPAGVVTVVVNSAAGSPGFTVTVGAVGPSLSLLDNKHVAGVVLTPDGSGAYGGGTYDLVGPVGAFAYKTRPVKPGEYLILYGVGFGATNPAVPAGRPFSGVAVTSNPVTFTIGGVPVAPAFAAMVSTGLYQFNLLVPSGIGSGERPVVATVSGANTPLAVVNIQ